MTYPLLLLGAALLWAYLLWVLTRAELRFWRFLVGALGSFTLIQFSLQSYLTRPLSQAVAALAGVVGNLTGAYTTFFKYGIIFVQTAVGAMTLQIDFECSGMIEITVFLCLLAFFQVYRPYEKIILGVVGTSYIVLCNAIRIVIICLALHRFGPDVYFMMHAFVGRIFFYIATVLLYFYVFTKPQVLHTKVGYFSYGHDKDPS